MIDTDPPAPPRIHFPHEYDRVHDSYGPGAFLGWIFLAYGVAAHFGGPREHRLYMALLDKDLVFTIAYPFGASFHLLSLFTHYPGSKHDIWAESDASAIQYKAAIWAPARVCVVSLGVNLVLAMILCAYKCFKRAILVIIASIWILIALIVVNSHDGDHFGQTIFGVFGFAFIFCMSGACVCMSFYVAATPVIQIYMLFSALLHARYMKALKAVGFLILILVFGSLFTSFALMMVYCFGYLLTFPESDHHFLDLGQVFPLAFGLINLGFALHGIAKEHGAEWWAFFLKDNGYERPPRYQRLPDQEAVELQSA